MSALNLDLRDENHSFGCQELTGFPREIQVHETSMRTALAEHHFESSAVKRRVHCQECGSDRVYRIERKGFMQKTIYPLFGYYPWRCMACRHHVMLRKRNRPRTGDEKFVG